MSLNLPYVLHQRAKAAVLVVSVAALSTIAACGQKDESQAAGQTAGQKLDTAVANTERAAAQAKANAEASMARAGDAMKDATKKAEASGADSVSAIAVKADDAAITASISAEFAKDADLSAIRIDIDTSNGNVTLNGPAPTEAARDKASALAKKIKGVVSVSNKLTVKAG